MKKVLFLLFLNGVFFVTTYSLYAMEKSQQEMISESVIVTQAHLDQFVDSIHNYTPFNMHGVFRIKQLAKDNKEWAAILADSTAMGTLIEYADHDYQRRGIRNVKARMAFELATEGSLLWCKEYLQTDERELKIMSNDFLSAARNNDYAAVKNFLRIGINGNVADQGNIESGRAARKFTYPHALISATKQLNVDMVTLLLDNNANPNVTTRKHEHSPLMIAMKRLYQADTNKEYEKFYKSFCITQLLLWNKETDLHHVNTSNKTISDYAKDYNIVWAIRDLLLLGVDGLFTVYIEIKNNLK